MASIIPGFEYDIFVSYRQKDNKGKHWVSEFVESLKIELETTLKEPLSIYFDLNPHDGLMSSHHVEKSLEHKLKCLIFIPVLSHTYCDPLSFAWQYEFCTFNKNSSLDKIGKTIRLSNGNAVSRILPVRVHTLDNSDLQLIKAETGSLPRPIDFIYEETGVNRPLCPEDDKHDNLNKTDYRNQINKLANIIHDIIISLINVTPEPKILKDEPVNICSLGNLNFLKKSIAVLPFTNLSNDPEKEYFGEGIAEEIINSLVHIEDLKVAGHLSSLQFKGAQSDFHEIGIKLGVCNVLVGSVQIHDDRIRITTRLISVEDGFNLWSEKYDRKLDDIFRIQDEIGQAITEKLKITLLKQEGINISRQYTQNPEAYELYLKGKFYTNKRGRYLLNAVKYFQQAIDLDPRFALAHAALADNYSLMASYGLAAPRMVMNKIKTASETAIKIDPALCEPYCSLGFYYVCFEWNWKEAKKNFLKSLELNPNSAQAHYWYGWNYLGWVEGNFEESEKHGKMAIKLEPLSAICYGIYARILLDCGNFRGALENSQKGLEIEPNSYLCQIDEGHSYLFLREFDLAVESFQNAIRISNRHHFAMNGLIWAYCKLGKYAEAKSLLGELQERSKKEYIGLTFTAISAAYLDDLDYAFECLDNAIKQLDPIIVTVKNETWFPVELTSDSRFQEIIDRVYSKSYVND